VLQRAEFHLLRKAIVVRNTNVIVFSVLFLPLSVMPTKEASEFLTSEFLTHCLKTINLLFSLGLVF